MHYYFAQPSVRPLLHRFDKASYFYIYYNATRHTSRIEVANNPGTPEQDAFNGYIDSCRVVNSNKFPTLLTIVVDGVTPQSPTSPKSGRDPEEWHLASADPRDPNHRKYRLHTLDVYLWAQEDAKLVTECFKRLLPRNQLDLADVEPEQHYQDSADSPQKQANVMSPVVQNLEHMAISDPAYSGQQKSAVSPSSSFASHNIPPPPPLGGSLGRQIHSPSPAISDLSSQPARQGSVRSNNQSSNFAPMAYNPAAPAAPEPIKHREKTPPPEDGATGTGLAQAASHDQSYVPGAPPAQRQQGGYQPGQGPPLTFGGGYASPPPQQPGHAVSPAPPTAHGSYGSPPPAGGYSYAGQAEQRKSAGSVGPSFGPGAPSTVQGQAGHHHSTAAETYVPHPATQIPVMTPGSQFYDSLDPSAKPLAHVQPQYADYLSAGRTAGQQGSSHGTPQPPQGGYSQYNYGSSPQQQQQGNNNPYDVHQQVYRPTEAEAGHHHRKQGSRTSTSDSRKPSTADKVETRAKSLFKRIEKKIG